MAQFNDPAIWQTARQKMPLSMLMTALGDGAYAKKTADTCPFCQAKKKFGIYVSDKSGRQYFKCFSPQCVAHNPSEGRDQIGYLSLRRGLSQKEAAVEFLKLAVPELVPHLFQEPKPKRIPRADGAEQQPGAAGGAEQDPGEAGEDPKIIDFREDPRDDREDPTDYTDPDAIPPRDSAPVNIWHSLWQRLPLTEADRHKLRTTRGFSDETIDTLGFRSNNQNNMTALEALMEEYGPDPLIETGIYKERKGQFSGQLLGWGRTNEKDKHGDAIFRLTEPILIPYLDELARPFYIRPHKGGIKRPKDEIEQEEEAGRLLSDDEDDSCSSHVYCPFTLADLIAINDGLCVLTEGEYKAAALWQAGIAAIACPGITFIGNHTFRRELLQLLRDHRVTDLVVMFDNEVKDDPAFPSYKPDPWDRWDTHVWAEYTVKILKDHFNAIDGSCRIGWLPDEYRTNGKVDCDGLLSRFVNQFGLVFGTKEARRVFLKVIEEAQDDAPDAELLPTEGRRIITCKLQRMFYKPLVHIGGYKEATLAQRFSEYDPNSQGPVDDQLSDIFRRLRGCYYKRKKAPAKEEADELNKEKAALERTIETLKQVTDSKTKQRDLRLAYSRKAAIWERLKGIPEDISDFVLSCEYKLHTHGGDVHRLVAVRDSKERGRKNGRIAELRKVTPTDLAGLKDFRRWCYSTGEAVWKGGDKELQMLVQDMDYHSYLRDIHEVHTYGYHPDGKLWFFGDCAFAPDGKTILPDQSNIFWYDGIGYQIELDNHQEKGSNFAQKAPMLQGPLAKTDPAPPVAAIFRQFAQDLYDTVGDYDGWLCLSLILAYAIGPDLKRVWNGHPSLWLVGKMSGGKTTVAQWLLRVWGFNDCNGTRIGESTSAVAMNRILQQYSSLPVWFDEFRRQYVDAQREEVLRGAFDRNTGAKGQADHTTKTRNAPTLTTPIVSGESSSSDAATRSRYGMVTISKHRRIGDGTARYNRVQAECVHYQQIGKYLMENRRQFAEYSLSLLESWMSNPAVRAAIPNERSRLVHGTAAACFQALATMLGEDSIAPSPASSGMARLMEYQTYLLKHGESALQDVVDETFLNQFWRDIISGIGRTAIKASNFILRQVVRDEFGKLSPVSEQTPGSIYVVYIAYESTFAEYQKDKAQRHEQPGLSLSDLRREMEKEPYWVPLPKKAESGRVHRIKIKGHNTTCWVLSLEKDKDDWLFPHGEDLVNALTSEDLPEP